MRRSRVIPFTALALGVAALVVSVCVSRDSPHATLKPDLTSDEWELREMLKYQGRGLDQEVKVRSFATSPSEEIIRKVGQRLEAEGFRVLVHFCADDGPWGPKDTWTLHADLEIVPSPENLCSLRERVKHVIEFEGAQYEGWGPPGQP